MKNIEGTVEYKLRLLQTEIKDLSHRLDDTEGRQWRMDEAHGVSDELVKDLSAFIEKHNVSLETILPEYIIATMNKILMDGESCEVKK